MHGAVIIPEAEIHPIGAVKQTEQDAVRSLERRTAEALLLADTAALDRLWGDDFTFTAPDGTVLTKSAYLSKLQAHEVEYETLAPIRIAVRLYGETALVNSDAIVKGRAGERSICSGIDSYLTVYVRREGRWQQAAAHATRLVKEEKMP